MATGNASPHQKRFCGAGTGSDVQEIFGHDYLPEEITVRNLLPPNCQTQCSKNLANISKILWFVFTGYLGFAEILKENLRSNML